MSSVDHSRTSYEYGSEPYKHDEHRGKWACKLDFYLASFGHAFGLKNIAILPLMWRFSTGLLPIFTFVAVIFCSVPIYFIQSSLGQFSSTGFLSIYRVSPIFKGIGYVILVLNISSATYYSIYATYSLIFFFKSFAAEFPWMSCNNAWNTVNCTTDFNSSLADSSNYYMPGIESYRSAPVEYFNRNILGWTDEEDAENFVVWSLVGCSIFVWTIVYIFLHNGIESVGKSARYTTIIGFGLFIIIFLRCIFLPGAMKGIGKSMFAEGFSFTPEVFLLGPIITIMCLGSGWGTISTMASYNNFKTDTVNYSFLIPFSIVGMTFISSIFLFSIYGYLNQSGIYAVFYSWHELEIPFAVIPYFFGLIEGSIFWSTTFYFMIFLFELNAITIQVFSILTALFDEYVWMRQYKKYISIGLCVVLFLGSIFFTTQHGSAIFENLNYAAGANQMLICFLELIMVMWVYGRERFQRDIKFMIGRGIPTWQFFVMRFTTPPFILLLMFFYTLSSFFSLYYEVNMVATLLVIIKILPWFVVPGYMIYKLYSSTGTLPKRFLKCVQPTDWYPVDSADRQLYETTLGSSEISQQLLSEDDYEK